MIIVRVKVLIYIITLWEIELQSQLSEKLTIK